MEAQYSIGDRVWYARINYTEKSIVCPDCLGQRYLTVIMGDKSKVTIGCALCGPGYKDPRGYVRYHEWAAGVEQVVVDGLKIDRDKVTYRFNGRYLSDDDCVFGTKEEANAKAVALAEKETKDELAEIHQKEKNHHTWAWHVRYHRECAKEAEKDLLYHRAKLDAARTKSKEGGKE